MWEYIYPFLSPAVHSAAPEPEFLNIQWRLKSQLFNESCLFQGQSVQQDLQLFCVASEDYFVKTIKKDIKIS